MLVTDWNSYNPLPEAVMELVWKFAFRATPNEVCGLIVDNAVVVRGRNIHEEPINNFTLDPMDYARAAAMGEVTAIYHSHTNYESDFSPVDRQQCQLSGVPWLLVNTTTRQTAYWNPKAIAPYLDRPWRYGIWDCYRLVQDYYLDKLGVTLPDFERGADREWDNAGWDVIRSNVLRVGQRVARTVPELHDVLMFQVPGPTVAHHFGVMAEPENNIFWHHPYGHFSRRQVWGETWGRECVAILRPQ